MSLSRSFLIDNNAAEKGFEFAIGEKNEDGTQPTILIARAGYNNRQYQSGIAKAYEKFALQDRAGIDSTLEKAKARIPVIAKHIVKGWANIPLGDVTGEDGLQGRAFAEGYADFSPENAIKLFERLPELFAIVEVQSHETSNFLVASREEAAKN
ncbi:Phage Tail assembly chaperone [Xanthomonas phage Suba]|uniref:Phage Tail assembly chaperone n=1 Tax=Xanthomonas phage Suba TaxID=2674975 RepID=A0A679K1M1_9CAUD|nr:Phage Tail assembly chaperone [Xanthomonas phage Suba]CAA2409756.1 Phage Tail assembly chaperone [Xanthomonas phage Suba]